MIGEESFLFVVRVLLRAGAALLALVVTRYAARMMGDNGIVLAAWPFVKPAHYWEIQFDLVEAVKAAFDAAGLTVPFPQRDLHVRTLVAPLPGGKIE